MTSAMAGAICRVLIVLMVWSPFQVARAGVIGTDEVVAASGNADRAAIVALIARADVASQLQALGIDPAAARDRVAALTDEEVRALSGKLNELPAGAISGTTVLIVLIIAAAVWYLWFR